MYIRSKNATSCLLQAPAFAGSMLRVFFALPATLYRNNTQRPLTSGSGIDQPVKRSVHDNGSSAWEDEKVPSTAASAVPSSISCSSLGKRARRQHL
jgi:hypothetical protein